MVETLGTRGVAVVTGASSGIGAATALRLAQDGFEVVAAARRADRLAEVAASHPSIRAVDDASVAALVASVPRCRVLVNNAGGAFDFAPVEGADLDAWRHTYEVNVLGTVRVTQSLLPSLLAGASEADPATVVVMGSTAGRGVYENGGSYTAAKHAEAAVAETLRLELNGRPVRVCEIAPGMVRTDEFALNRFHGDSDRAAKVYAGVDAPLSADDVADCVSWVVTRPPHVDIDLLVVRPLAQAAQHKVHRRS
jgi:NADP-dependent 3-hydroxy acid dehydrogenase YdfG